MPLSSVPGSVWPAQRNSLSDVQASVHGVLVLWLGFLPSSAVMKMLVRACLVKVRVRMVSYALSYEKAVSD
jgi:hypothetical protein